jgi:hypothetical protein
VAIFGVMLVGVGFSPLRAAALALVADTAPVAFGAIAIPITTLAQVIGLPVHDLGAMVGRQTPFLALIVPFALGDNRRIAPVISQAIDGPPTAASMGPPTAASTGRDRGGPVVGRGTEAEPGPAAMPFRWASLPPGRRVHP